MQKLQHQQDQISIVKRQTTTKVNHIYDIKDPFDTRNYQNPALVKGKVGEGETYTEVTLERGETGGLPAQVLDGSVLFRRWTASAGTTPMEIE
jgi:hypothetical protein